MKLQRDSTIDAAPEYLQVQLKLENHEEGYNEMYQAWKEENKERKEQKKKPLPALRRPKNWKNRSHIEVPEMLDITQHMTYQGEDPTPVRYRLVHVVYHCGESLEAGHYVAGVTSAPRPGDRIRNRRRLEKQWMCNDSVVDQWTMPDNVDNKLTIVPLDFEADDRQIKGGEP